MDLRQLRYFVAVAEELHFSRAAVRLSLAQSALSAQIRALEEEIGGPLLVRSTRKVELTPAGTSLLEDAREVLRGADAALRRARSLARGESGSIAVGSLGPAPGGVLAPILERFSVQHPRVRVEVRSFDFTELVAGLREHHADVAFLYAPLHEPDFVVVPLVREPRVVVLSAGHRLAGRESLCPEDLRREMFIRQPPEVPDDWCDFWMLVDDLGTRPPVSPHTGATLEEWLHLIGRGEGIDTAPALISRYYAWPEVVFIPLQDAAPSTLVLAHLAGSENPLVADFARHARESFTAAGDEVAPGPR